jgi:zinc and cadmium transporter
MTLIYIILAVLIVSIISFAGIFTLLLKKKNFHKIISILISFAAGCLLGAAFFHLIPEAIEQTKNPFLMIIAGIVIFFFIEIFLHWHHCQTHAGEKECSRKNKTKPVGILNLSGDAVHNFTDGIIIGASFIADIRLGIITTIAVAMHEIPQELGDFGILIHAGFSTKKALLFNFLSALTAVIGGITVYFFASSFNSIIPYLLSFAAGGFIYISMTDLLSEIKEEKETKKLFLQFIMFIIGLALMFFTQHFLH